MDYFNIFDKENKFNFQNKLYNEIKNNYNNKKLVILCIGTDRATGDCLGPIVGNNLKDMNVEDDDIYIYGTLDNPVHAKNLNESIHEIKKLHPYIIAIDACLGKLENVGHVTFGIGPIKPGSGVNKDLPEIGDFHINGIVNMSGFMEFLLLQNTRLSLVMKMADYITSGLIFVLDNLKNERTIVRPSSFY